MSLSTPPLSIPEIAQEFARVISPFEPGSPGLRQLKGREWSKLSDEKLIASNPFGVQQASDFLLNQIYQVSTRLNQDDTRVFTDIVFSIADTTDELPELRAVRGRDFLSLIGVLPHITPISQRSEQALSAIKMTHNWLGFDPII